MTAGATVLMLAAGISAFAGNGKYVSICLDNSADVHPSNMIFAERKASAIFYGIGVQLRWDVSASCSASSDPVRITIADLAPRDAPPGATAYAYPYERGHLVVIYDRVRRLECHCIQNPALGYVLAHEIAHILEGINRHSESGVLKAHWERADYEAMLNASLRFAPEDISLIHLGLNNMLARR